MIYSWCHTSLLEKRVLGRCVLDLPCSQQGRNTTTNLEYNEYQIEAQEFVEEISFSSLLIRIQIGPLRYPC
jgi:hypothetical protein